MIQVIVAFTVVRFVLVFDLSYLLSDAGSRQQTQHNDQASNTNFRHSVVFTGGLLRGFAT
jgi:hypothetical protein